MWKVILFDRLAREKIFEGIEEIAKTVWVTLGSYWYNVIIDNLFAQPTVCNDWITVLRSIDFKDRYKNIAAFMMKKASDRQNKIAGDWTTTCAILARALCKEWLKHIDTWINPFKLVKYLNEYTKEVADYIKSKASPINDTNDIERVATISAQDDEIWAMIADAFERVGKDWTVIVEEIKNTGMYIEMKKWYEWDEPMKSHLFINSPERLQCELDAPYILVTDKKLISLQPLWTMIDWVISAGKKDILFIVDDIDQGALDTLIFNKMKNMLNVCVVKAPLYWERKDQFYRDICAMTGATLISNKTWVDFANMTVDHLWKCEKLISWRASTLIVGWDSNETEIQEIVTWIDKEIVNTTDERVIKLAEERKAKLTGWIATIKVWYASDMETENKRMKIEDAVQATKAAIKEGIIYWEGVSLIEGIQFLKTLTKPNINKEADIAMAILEKALEYPTKMIIDNAGQSWDWAVKAIKTQNIFWTWYDIKNDVLCDLLKIWVIDPVMVVRVALENAVSLANMILSSRAVVTEDPKENIDDHDQRVV